MGTGIPLNGNDTYITLPAEILNGKKIFTIELKLSTTETRSSTDYWDAPCLCGFTTPEKNTGDFNIGIKQGKLISTIGLGYEDTSNILTNDLINDGTIYSITLVSDGNTATLYKNGVAYPTTGRVSMPLSNIQICIGNSLPQSEAKSAMTLYEARFWDIARNTADLGATITGNETGLRGWYKCLELGGNTLIDSSSNAFNGTIVGNVWADKWPLPMLTAPTIRTVNTIVTANASFTKVGIGVTRCGFFVKKSLADQVSIVYEAGTTPTFVGEEYTAQLTNLLKGYSYIAAFAENPAGRVTSEFVSYQNGVLAFKYLNPGMKDLFDDVSPRAEEHKDWQSRTSGYSFSVNSGHNTLNLEPCKEYWVACGYYNRNTYGSTVFPLFTLTKGTNNITINSSRLNSTLETNFIFKYNNSVIIQTNKFIKNDRINHIEFYIKDDVADGIIKAWFDGILVCDYRGAVGNGEGFDIMQIATDGNRNNDCVLSDLIVQNTGYIGDMRVNVLPPNLGSVTCNWTKGIVPIGYNPNMSDNWFSAGTTLILKDCQFTDNGIIHAFLARVRIAPTLLKICLFRRNENNKYNPISLTNICINNEDCLERINLAMPMRVKSGDYLGFYISKGYLYCMNNTYGECVSISTDITGGAEIDLPTTIREYNPCICALFEPENPLSAAKGLSALQQKDSQLASYGHLETDAIDKTVTCSLDLSKIKIGRIDTIGISTSAHYEGESPARSLCSIVKLGVDEYKGALKPLTTSKTKYLIDVLSENPLTNMQWDATDLQSLQIGIKSKA